MWLNFPSGEARRCCETLTGLPSVSWADGRSAGLRLGRVGCLSPRHIPVVLQTGIRVRAGRIFWDLFTPPVAGMVTSRSPEAYHFSRMACPETRLDRGSGLLSERSETRPGTRFAGLASSRQTSQSQRTSH